MDDQWEGLQTSVRCTSVKSTQYKCQVGAEQERERESASSKRREKTRLDVKGFLVGVV